MDVINPEEEGTRISSGNATTVFLPETKHSAYFWGVGFDPETGRNELVERLEAADKAAANRV
jgi:hypothetical protein